MIGAQIQIYNNKGMGMSEIRKEHELYTSMCNSWSSMPYAHYVTIIMW